MECWRLLIDAANPKPADQFPGWPKTIRYTDNYGRKPAAHLPTIKVQGLENPVVQVKNAKTGELVYALRIRGNSFRPPVFEKEETYEVRVGEPDRELWKTLKSLKGESGDSPSTRTVKF